jgi:hypothetical protein
MRRPARSRNGGVRVQATFDQAQQVRQVLGRNPRDRGETPVWVYPLTGLLRSGHCWAKMREHTGSNGQQSYICPTHCQRTGTCCKRWGDQLINLKKEKTATRHHCSSFCTGSGVVFGTNHAVSVSPAKISLTER